LAWKELITFHREVIQGRRALKYIQNQNLPPLPLPTPPQKQPERAVDSSEEEEDDVRARDGAGLHAVFGGILSAAFMAAQAKKGAFKAEALAEDEKRREVSRSVEPRQNLFYLYPI
jgi:hypothetical protein